MLTADMKRIVREQRLGFVATVKPTARPTSRRRRPSPCSTMRRIAFAEIRSPGTLRNLRANPAIEVNFVDPFVRKGYRFAGTAKDRANAGRTVSRS